MAVNSGASSRRDSADMGLCWSMCLLGIISLIFHPRPCKTVPISNSPQAPETLYRICCIRNVKSTILRPRPSLWKGELRIWMGWFLGTITAISGHGQGIRAHGFNGQGLDAQVRGLGCRTADPREDEGVFPLGPSSFCFRLCVVLLGSETAKYIAAESQAQKLHKTLKAMPESWMGILGLYHASSCRQASQTCHCSTAACNSSRTREFAFHGFLEEVRSFWCLVGLVFRMQWDLIEMSLEEMDRLNCC